MAGIITTFTLDLMAISCLIPTKGDCKELVLVVDIRNYSIKATLFSENPPTLKKPNEAFARFIYNKISISITNPEEDLSESEFIEGRARYLLMEYRHIVVDVINKIISYFKYKKRNPGLRFISIIDLLKQELELCNPKWESMNGAPITVSQEPITSGIIVINGIGYLQDNLFGSSLFSLEDSSSIQDWFSSADNTDVMLAEQLLSDAQSAAISNNFRRAILELVVSIEVFVKEAFFKQDKISASVFEYIEDKGRETVKIIELLDGASISAFGESFKAASPASFRNIDHAFRCRNKIAHRGEVRFRDDSGVWHSPDRELLIQWWNSTLEMFAWLNTKVYGINSSQ